MSRELPLLEDLIQNNSADYFTLKWHRYFEKWVPWIREHSQNNIHEVSTHKAFVYAGDLYGYLTDLSVNKRYHWAIMRLNNMKSPTEFNEEWRFLVFPSMGIIDNIMGSMDVENQNDNDLGAEW